MSTHMSKVIVVGGSGRMGRALLENATRMEDVQNVAAIDRPVDAHNAVVAFAC